MTHELIYEAGFCEPYKCPKCQKDYLQGTGELEVTHLGTMKTVGWCPTCKKNFRITITEKLIRELHGEEL